MTKQTIIFSTTNQIFSRLIRFFTKSKVSHCAIGLDIGGMDMVAHATVSGIVLVPRSRFTENNTIIKEFIINQDIENNIVKVFEDLGVQYDYVGVFGFGLVNVLKRWFGLKIKNPLASSKAMVCSEFVVALNKYNNKIESWKDIDPETITPQELLDICYLDTDNFIPL